MSSNDFNRLARQIRKADDAQLDDMMAQATRALADDSLPLGEHMGWIVARDMLVAEAGKRGPAVSDAELLAELMS